MSKLIPRHVDNVECRYTKRPSTTMGNGIRPSAVDLGKPIDDVLKHSYPKMQSEVTSSGGSHRLRAQVVVADNMHGQMWRV